MTTGTNIVGKGFPKTLSPTLNRVYALLSQGGKYSAMNIIEKCKTSDPRSAIRHLRNLGINIQDEWCSNRDGVNYKIYFLKQ